MHTAHDRDAASKTRRLPLRGAWSLLLLTRCVLIATVLVAGLLTSPPAAPAQTTAPAPTTALQVVGNQLRNAAGQPIRLLGVNHSGSEYACAQGGSASAGWGWGLYDADLDGPRAQAIKAWGTNVVRIPLNEDCWLGINNINPAYGGASYQTYIQGLVGRLRQAGLYVILDLHWSAPGTIVPLAQQALPDLDHAPAFWQSVATTFQGDQGVVFDLFNEPFIYTSETQDPNQNIWACWRDGCAMSVAVTGGNPYNFSFR